MMTRIRLVIVDDHELFREGLRELLAHADDLEVVAMGASVRDAIRLVERHHPDVLLLDIGLEESSGLSALPELRRMDRTLRVLMLTMHSAHDYVVEAFDGGALGYAVKDQPISELLTAIRTVAGGRRYLAPRVERALSAAPYAEDPRPMTALSPRELEIFDLAVRGFSSDAIAHTLCISVKTVQTHRTHINRKLGVHSSAELVRYAARHGLLLN